MTVTRWRMGFNWVKRTGWQAPSLKEGPWGSGLVFFLAFFLEQRDQVMTRPLDMFA